jgi:type II secretory pathway pseudopilin PulG
MNIIKSLTRTPNGSGMPKGFALVVTLLLLVLLSLLCLGMLSLSSISLRASVANSALSEARMNARMALVMAIGELQKQAGPDQRISASGAIISDTTVKHPHWTGVWDSWKAGSDTSGDDDPSEHSTIEGVPNSGMAPSYETNRQDHFRSWLVSLNPEEANQVSLPTDLALDGVALPGGAAAAVRLVGEGSLGTGSATEDFVSARLLPVKSSKTGSAITGRYGWWVGDESQKARVMEDPYDAASALTDADRIYRSQAPGSMGNTTIPGLEGTTSEEEFGRLPSLRSLDLVSVDPEPADGAPKVSQASFHNATIFSHGVLADVREGGLKRDLSTILEQPIRLEDNGQEFMLYEFDDPRFPYLYNPNDERRANSRVPIQDLAAYYQLYDHQPGFANGRREGVQYTSTALPNTLQIKVPDHDGGNKNRDFLIREYTSLYKRPVVTKVQFLVGATAQPISQAERDWIQEVVDGTKPSGGNPQWQPNFRPIRGSDTLKLKLGVQPMVTLWNPTNLPLVMEAKQILRYNVPPFGIKIRKYRAGGDDYESLWMNLGYANNSAGGTSNGQAGGNLLDLRLANDTIVFEPGEVKVFSIPDTAAAYLTDDGDNEKNTLAIGSNMDVVNEWDPFGVFLMRNSAAMGHYNNQAPDAQFLNNNGQRAQTLFMSPSDRISLSVDSESATTALSRADGRNASRDATIRGAGFGLHIFDEGYMSGHWSTWADAMRHDILLSRHGSSTNENRAALGGFYRELMLPGFPGGEAPIEFDNETNAISGQQLKLAGENGEIIALMDFSLSIGCETSSTASGGFGGGRRITSRPFLHSATPALPFITNADKASLYDYGMDWQISKINTVEDSILQAKPDTGNGYYGGGYTIENGTTHVIQNEIPVLPPISIASLSHAYLGGFSMAKAIPVGEDPDNDTFWFKSGPVNNPTGVTYQRVTASGQNGLAPQMGQAIGNSYAHPNIPADEAFTTKARIFDLDEGSFEVPYVDHSYLANKSLWDEFFFSSIAPQPAKVPLFGSTDRTAKQVADDFFFNDMPLPNRRINPYKAALDQAKLDTLFTQASTYTSGLADKIAAHLMVDGAFNVNSTSVEAWKVFLSSLKGKPVAYLDGGVTPNETVPEGATVSPGSLPNAVPIKTAAITSPNLPPEQWKTGRELTDEEIGELAVAMVKQVKLRGPFLSLSEFINRRLDGSNKEFAIKGALQAALDDKDVSINAAFRTAARMLNSETAGIGFAFPEAAEGPVAYGSSAYVDQADILRSFAGQLTPRGDTFVIRTYGDSMDSAGNVLARAWCEAVVQRFPDYVDGTDENHIKAALLQADANKAYGRKFKIVSFRWLNSSEV